MAVEPALTFSRLSPSILDAGDRLRVGRQILAVLEDHLGSSGLGGRRVLDIGCSSGVITSFLADVAGTVVGIDVDRDALQRAEREVTRHNVRFLNMSASALDFPSESFDVVICNQVYYWLAEPERLMAEIHRVLVPGGACFFATVNKYKLWEAQYRLPLLSMLPRAVADAYVRAAGKGERFGCRYLSVRQLRRLCRPLTIHSYTARILSDPDRYKFSKLSMLKTLTRRLPLNVLEAVEPLSPNIIWVLEKRPARASGVSS